MKYNLQDKLPALSEDDVIDKSLYTWVYVSKEIGWVYTLRDPPPTDAPQPDLTQLPTQGQDDQSKLADNSEWKTEGEEGMRSDFQKQPEQPPRGEVDHLGTPKMDYNLASLSEHKPSTDTHKGEKLASRVAFQTFEQIDADQNQEIGNDTPPTKPSTDAHKGEKPASCVASQTFEQINADQNQKTGNDAPPTMATKVSPSSGSAQHDGHNHHHRDRVRMDPRRDPNLLGIDMYSIYLRSIGVRPLDHPTSPSVSGGDGKRPNVNTASENDDHAMKEYSFSQLPLKDEWKHEDVPDKIIEGRTQSDAVQLDNPSSALPAGVDDKTPPTEDDAPPSAGIKDKTSPTEDDAPAGVKDKTPPTEDDAPPSDAPANIDDRTSPTADDVPPSDASAGIDDKTPPPENDAPLSDGSADDKIPPTEDDAPPSDAPAGIDDKTQDDTPLEDSPDDKTCSTEDEEVQPSNLDNATSPSEEAPHFGIEAPPSTRREVPPPSLLDGEQEEGKHEPESNIPDQIADRKYYSRSPDSVSSTYVYLIVACISMGREFSAQSSIEENLSSALAWLDYLLALLSSRKVLSCGFFLSASSQLICCFPPYFNDQLLDIICTIYTHIEWIAPLSLTGTDDGCHLDLFLHVLHDDSLPLLYSSK